MFNRVVKDRQIQGYYCQEKLNNGQTIAIVFSKYNTGSQVEFRVALAIANKKKHIREWFSDKRDLFLNQETGRCGLEGLLWAKRKIQEFEDYLQHYCSYCNVVLRVDWTDNRRRDVYLYGLQKIGFKLAYRENQKCLMKKIA